jgi:hypothetical protein
VSVFWNDDDIPSMLADSPNVITATPESGPPVTGPCLRLESDELKLDSPGSAPLVMHLVRVFVQTTLFGFLVSGSACNVDGVAYTVWKTLMEGDGALTQLLLRVS